MQVDARTQAFRTLKPPCVALSQSALGLMGGRGSVTEVMKHLEQLLQTLEMHTISTALDEKLADYVFFPISQVLRQMEKLPLRAQELTLKCIAALLETAWKSTMAPDLGLQLLILFSFFADSTDETKMKSSSSEEMLALVFSCMDLVFQSLGSSSRGKDVLVATENMPHLGKYLSVILEGALRGSTAAIQLAALGALHSFCTVWPDRVALSTSFFPGIISCLTKILSPKPSERRAFNVMVTALRNLGQLLSTVLGDADTKHLPESCFQSEGESGLDKAWLKGTAGQVKLALSNIIKLRSHDRRPVRQAIGNFCMQCLEVCWESLSESRSMLLETIAVLAADDEVLEKELKYLAMSKEAVTDTLRSSLYHWVVALPRIMLSTDVTAKRRLLNQTSLTFKLLDEEGVDLSRIEQSLGMNLRDSIVNTITSPKHSSAIVEYQSNISSMTLANQTSTVSKTFDPILAIESNQRETMDDITRLVLQISSNDGSLQLISDLVSSLQNTKGDTQLASFWLSLSVLRNICENWLSATNFFELDGESESLREILAEQLYAFALTNIAPSSHDRGLDWRIQALSLEVVALQAGLQKEDFRPELIEVLYPILHSMGSSNPAIQKHALTCLNIVAEQCGYKDTRDLILKNVDYLVNAVNNQLGGSELSPQAPQVLSMMVRLAGPSLLPYLDDLVDSIFTALESFHGYPKLAELLFFALKTIVEEGVKTPQLAIKNDVELERERASLQPIFMSDLLHMIRSRKVYEAKRLADDSGSLSMEGSDKGGFPRRPWAKSLKPEGKHSSTVQGDEGPPEDGDASKVGDNQEESSANRNSEDPPPPVPRTYSLIMNITRLTQHYLTSSSLELRISLLALIKTTAPALAAHENSFLPLINTTWPVLLQRLKDQEAYVVSGALDVISSLCINAGEFMRSRTEEAWPELQALHARCKNTGRREPPGLSKDGPISLIRGTAALPAKSGIPSDVARIQIRTPSRIILHSLIELFKGILTHVTINDEMFDDIVEVALPVLDWHPDIRDALRLRNPDAVWLALQRLKTKENDLTKDKIQPFPNIVKPVDTHRWRFAQMLG